MTVMALTGGCGVDDLEEEISAELSGISLSNPGFESDLTGWTEVEPASVSSVAHTGTRSGKVSASTGRVKRTVSGLAPSTGYVLSAWVQGEARIGVRNHGTAEVSATKAASAWTKVSVSFTTGASSTTAEIYAAWAGGGDARVDDFALVPSAANLTPGAAGVIASTSDANVAAGAVDQDLATRWSGYGDGAWLRLDLGAVKTVSYVKVAVYDGAARKNAFDLQVSADGTTWSTVWSGASSGTTAALVTYDFPDVQARYVRYVGHGYVSGTTSKLWSSVTEITVFGLGASTPAPAPSGSCSVPAGILDLSSWKLTLPVGAPTEIEQPDLATYALDPWFRSSSDCTAVRFRAPTSGATTSGSSYPRSELREMTGSNGTTRASWSTTSGTHRMLIDEAITAVPRGKPHVVAGQIHDADDDVIVIRLEHPRLFIDINGNDGPTLDASYVLGRRFTVEFVAHDGLIDVHYNGAATPAYRLSRSVSGCYFKAGAYTQSNCTTEAERGQTCATDNYGEVAIYDVVIRHQ